MNNSHKLKQVNPNLSKWQFTFFSDNYKPVACVIETEKNFVEIIKNEATFKRMAIVKICQKRSWSSKDFAGYGYSKFKYRRIKEV